ncbi:hypothetical protein EW145_g4447 [Phellinidium pouzarii]|uniref:mannan endo-1,4-beta-mannosidase n=1 Tax=Phellinidium pouzarii TaxID=167371 RepID=A0A4S4L5B1_9AGAM|nr:hypothetical protein EW145_g4447 [Phellinidium pouzarii]
MKRVGLFAALTVIPFASAQSSLYGQCGGIGWTGATTCVSGSVCTVLNSYYSQCLPGAASSSESSASSAPVPSTSTVAPSPTSSAPSSTPTTVTGFVKTSGQKFVLNGDTFTVAGTNAYWLAQEMDADIDTAFNDIVTAGLTTVRTWGFNDVTTPQEYGAYYQLWTDGVATFNTGDYGISRFDAVVASAKSHGVRLIVSLTNNWSDYGGMDVYVSQLNPGGTHDTFYTDATVIAAYKNYISEFVGRYEDEPTIMAWELANEPRCSGSTGSVSAACDTTGSTIAAWASEISAYIKSIDSNHLVAIGDEGWFEWTDPPTYPYAPGVGIDFDTNLAIPTLDFGTLHSYPESWGQSANESLWGVQWIADHANSQKTANKPVLIEEFGVTTNQEEIYTGWYNEIISSGMTGDLIWQAGSELSTGPSPQDGYAIYPSNTVYTLQESAAAALKARGPVGLQNITPFSVPPHVGLHIYDTYKNELTTGLNHYPFSRDVFDQIKRYEPEITKQPEWDTACSAFRAFEKDAETAIRSLVQQVNSKPRHSQLYGVSSASEAIRSVKPKLSLGRHAMQSLQKYLIFLRFRNRDTYAKLLKLASEGCLFLRDRNADLSRFQRLRPGDNRRESMTDWKELLKSFIIFFSTDPSQHRTTSFVHECIHRRYENIQDAEICIGLASEPDEYILSAACFGVVEEDGAGNLNDSFYYFFPISPHLTLYMLIEAPFVNSPTSFSHFLDHDAPVPSFLDHDVESSVDVYQRNALLLQTLPRYLIFVSSRSMMRTLTYYNERRWLPENLDYSKLLRGCREESVTHMLLVKASIEVIDLTDEVTLIGKHAISFGSFADIWKGVWSNRQEKGKNLVALKVLRAHLDGNKQERLLERLKTEVKAWYRLEHPHVAKLYGVMQHSNSLAMVSPWCENGTIVKYLRESNPDADRLQLLYEIASGVSYLHSCDPVVVHGDLKGCNILIDAGGHAIITDFGLAKVKEVSEVSELRSSLFAGSTRWMAPELLLAQVEDDRKPPISTFSDVYAFASVCLEVLTGQLPYAKRRNDHGVIMDILNGVKPTSGIQVDIDDSKTEELWSMINECWDKIPRARPGMEKMCDCLKRVRSK